MDKVENFKKNIFDAIAVDNIVWIDDRFSESNNSIVKEYIAELKAIYDSDLVDLVSEFDAFNGINFQLPYFELIEPSIPKDDMTIGRFYEHINKEVPDFTRSQFDDLIGIFNGVVKKGVYKYTFRQWSENKNTHFKNDKECYLYLVDYNFEAEGLGSDYGKEIIKDILSCSNPGNNYCVLFTSEINRGQQEEDKRKEIISDFSENGNIIDTHGFSVLAKSIIAPTENVCLGFKSAEFIKRIFLRKLSSEMLISISKELASAIGDITQELSQKSIYEIDYSIFQNSINEGSSELELLLRLFSIKQSQVIYNLLDKENEIVYKLKRYRSVQKIEFKKDTPHTRYLDEVITAGKALSNLREIEVFDSSINKIHSPLCNGDIFRFDFEGGYKLFILVEQECDLSVRKDGKRKKNEVILIPIEERVIKNSSASDKLSFQKKCAESKYHLLKIPSDSSNDFYCLFDFSCAITVNVNLLDLCVFNQTGSLSYRVNHEESDLVFLPGWIERFNQLKSSLTVSEHVDGNQNKVLITKNIPDDYSCFSMFSKDIFVLTSSEDEIKVNGFRVKRLKHPFVNELTRNYFIGYKSRHANEIDFSE